MAAVGQELHNSSHLPHTIRALTEIEASVISTMGVAIKDRVRDSSSEVSQSIHVIF